MLKQRWLLVLGGVLILLLASGGAGLALGRRSGGPMTGPGLNGSGYGSGMMSSGGTPFGGFMQRNMMNGELPGGSPGGMMGGGTGGMMLGTSGGTPTGGASITLDQARQAVQSSLDRLGNPDLAIDEVMEFQDNFYALVIEKSTGRGAFELLVTKSSGTVTPEYGPNMLWNTKYGMIGWQRDAKEMTVSAEQATALATAWLTQNQPGVATEAPDTFYGYYTIHLTKDGSIVGMLSVNGYTGQIWYHTWHGAFIRMQ
jgi:hypothetical protein